MYPLFSKHPLMFLNSFGYIHSEELHIITTAFICVKLYLKQIVTILVFYGIREGVLKITQASN